jgi:preprotein translocase subunit SecB
MRVSPLRLEGYYIKELHVALQSKWKIRSDYPALIAPEHIVITIVAGQHKENERQRLFEVTIELQKQAVKSYPYNFKATLVGFFEVSEHFPSEHAEVMVNANAPALLYSAARELIASTTGRGPLPALTLPSVTFIEPPQTSGAVRKGLRKMVAKGAKRK